MIKINMFKAEDGDAFLLNFDSQQNILIDMGMPKTYENEIKEKLIYLKDKEQRIDLLIISHIDEDHIGGAIKFLENNKENQIIEVSEIWHNSFKHLQFNKLKVRQIDTDTKLVLNSMIEENQTINIQDGDNQISCKQGSSFASLIHKYNYHWNTSFSNDTICLENKREIILENIKFIFLSPSKEKLEKLSKKWLKELEKKKYDFEISDEEIFDDAFEFYVKQEQDYDVKDSPCSSKNKIDFNKLSKIEEKDSSLSNGSSIAFIIEYKDKKLLFLGDAHEDIVYDSLEKLKNEKYELVFDLVKISHHGSNKNISNRLVKLVDSKIFLFSTNGISNKHPNLETISKILMKETEYKKEFYFNYHQELFDSLNDEILKSKYNYEVKIQSEIILK